MVKSRLLMYGLMEDENYYVDFYFNINQVQAYFIADQDHISIVLSGQIYELEYDAKILGTLKHHLNLSYN